MKGNGSIKYYDIIEGWINEIDVLFGRVECIVEKIF